jgi:hypothetical protein
MRIETLFLVPGQRATRLHRRELGKFDDNSWLFCRFLTSLHLNVHCSIVLLSLLNTDGVTEEITIIALSDASSSLHSLSFIVASC